MSIYDNYKYINDKTFITSVNPFLISITVLLIILILIINIPFKKYKQFRMTLLEKNIYEIYMNEEDIDLFKNTLIYEKEKYFFKIIEIDPNYYFNIYRRITISVNFKINIPNKIYEILVYENESTFLKELLKEV